MTRLWILEHATFNDDVWTPFWCYFDYDVALSEARRMNRLERSMCHRVRYRISDIICNDNLVKV